MVATITSRQAVVVVVALAAVVTGVTVVGTAHPTVVGGCFSVIDPGSNDWQAMVHDTPDVVEEIYLARGTPDPAAAAAGAGALFLSETPSLFKAFGGDIGAFVKRETQRKFFHVVTVPFDYQSVVRHARLGGVTGLVIDCTNITESNKRSWQRVVDSVFGVLAIPEFSDLKLGIRLLPKMERFLMATFDRFTPPDRISTFLGAFDFVLAAAYENTCRFVREGEALCDPAPFEYAESAIDGLLTTGFPRDRIMLGLPTFVRDADNRKLSPSDRRLAASAGSPDDTGEDNKLEWTGEDELSLKTKLHQLVEGKNLRGFFFSNLEMDNGASSPSGSYRSVVSLTVNQLSSPGSTEL